MDQSPGEEDEKRVRDLKDRGIIEWIFGWRLIHAPPKSVMMFAFRPNDQSFRQHKFHIGFEWITHNCVTFFFFNSKGRMIKQWPTPIGENGFGYSHLPHKKE